MSRFNFEQPEGEKTLFDFSIFVSDEEVLENMKKENKSNILDEDVCVLENINKRVLLTKENAKTYYKVAKFLYANDENKHIFENNIEKNEQALSFYIRFSFNNRDENPFKVLRSIFLFLNDEDAKDMIEEKMAGEEDLTALVRKYNERIDSYSEISLI
jgi:hypothetical protein